MSIREIRLTSFRGFREVSLQCKPLTVLLGPNSAGKSSFGHALAAMSHAQKIYASTSIANLTPASAADQDKWPIDLGTTRDLRTHGVEGPIKIALTMRSGSSIELGFGGLAFKDDLILSYASYPVETSTSQPLPQSSLSGQSSTPVTTSAIPVGERSVVAPAPRLEIRKINEQEWIHEGQGVAVIPDGLIFRGVQHFTGTQQPLNIPAINELRALLMQTSYLRANRKRPCRGYAEGSAEGQAIGYSGEFTATVLSRSGNVGVQYAVPSADAASTQPWQSFNVSLHDGVAHWLSHLELAQQVDIEPPIQPDTRPRMRVKLRDQVARDITEVGFGVSQVVPILVSGLLQPPTGGLFVVDLPEGHLHPRPQGRLADFFCSLALSGKHCLVETHSEMFFHQLRLRAATNPELAKQIAVYFIDQPTSVGCVTPRLVGLDFDDELKWPKGFFQESWELERNIQLARKKGNSPQ